jgi:hypothetical protein
VLFSVELEHSQQNSRARVAALRLKASLGAHAPSHSIRLIGERYTERHDCVANRICIAESFLRSCRCAKGE